MWCGSSYLPRGVVFKTKHKYCSDKSGTRGLMLAVKQLKGQLRFWHQLCCYCRDTQGTVLSAYTQKQLYYQRTHTSNYDDIYICGQYIAADFLLDVNRTGEDFGSYCLLAEWFLQWYFYLPLLYFFQLFRFKFSIYFLILMCALISFI